MGPYVMVLMFVGIGGLFAYLGYTGLVSTREKVATWLHLQGTVVGFVERQGSKGSTLYAPTYRYTAGGAERTLTSGTASTPPAYKLGNTVNLVVNPVKPDEAEIIDGSTALFTYGMLGLGLAMVAIGVLVLWLVVSGRWR